jgi:hypothetical protein
MLHVSDGVLILLIFTSMFIIMLLIGYLGKGKFDPVESGRQHIRTLLTSREQQNEHLVLNKLSCDADNNRKRFFYREVSKIFEVEPGYLRHDDRILELTSVCLNDLGVFSGETVIYHSYFKYDTVDVFIYELYYLFEKYYDPELLIKDPAASQITLDSEDKLIDLIRSLSIGNYIELMCRIVDAKKARKIDMIPEDDQ